MKHEKGAANGSPLIFAKGKGMTCAASMPFKPLNWQAVLTSALSGQIVGSLDS